MLQKLETGRKKVEEEMTKRKVEKGEDKKVEKEQEKVEKGMEKYLVLHSLERACMLTAMISIRMLRMLVNIHALSKGPS